MRPASAGAPDAQSQTGRRRGVEPDLHGADGRGWHARNSVPVPGCFARRPTCRAATRGTRSAVATRAQPCLACLIWGPSARPAGSRGRSLLSPRVGALDSSCPRGGFARRVAVETVSWPRSPSCAALANARAAAGNARILRAVSHGSISELAARLGWTLCGNQVFYRRTRHTLCYSESTP